MFFGENTLSFVSEDFKNFPDVAGSGSSAVGDFTFQEGQNLMHSTPPRNSLIYNMVFETFRLGLTLNSN